MSFEEFTETVRNAVAERLSLEVAVKTVPKNNGVILTGLIIMDKNSNTAPAIYLDSFYEEYQQEKDMEETISSICKAFHDNSFSHPVDFSDFVVFETAKKQIVFRLVNYEKNLGILEEIPHRRFLDLAIVYYYVVQKPPFNGKASIRLNNHHMKIWGVTEEKLYQTATANTPKLLPVQITDIQQHIGDMTETVLKGLLSGNEEMQSLCIQTVLLGGLMDEIERLPMYVMSNTDILMGAACMLYPDSLKAFAEKMQRDLYILPSSVHETILLPVFEEAGSEGLYEMVREVNRNQVAVEERLSDNVYIYRRATDSIELA